MRRTVEQVICDTCGLIIEVEWFSHRNAETVAKMHQWLQVGDKDYCAACKRAARLASDLLVMKREP